MSSDIKISRGMIGAKKKRELLDFLLASKNVTVEDIVNNTSIGNTLDAHKYLKKLSKQHGFKLEKTSRKKRLAVGATHISLYALAEESFAKARDITLTELANQTERLRLIKLIKQLAAEGLDCESIAAQCDETKQVVAHICRQQGICVARKSAVNTLRISRLDQLTIYRPLNNKNCYL